MEQLPVVSAGAGNKNPPVAPPEISLPKGGGALRGIDEKFSVSPATGTGSLSIPLPLTPGRSGFTPAVSLSYDSGSGNGSFGLGWSLRVGSISRKTEKSLPQYRDGEESDIFLLSGAEDLVPSLNSGGERDSFEREGFDVLRYRPRIEGLFARIERWTNTATGDIHWRTTTKENVTSLYGRDPSARLADPADPRRVLRWFLEESADDRGNVIRYEYKAENGAGVSPSDVFEKNRFASGFSNTYLKRIFYGNQTPFQPTEWHFQIVFDFGEHGADGPSPDEIRPWPRRLDSFSSYRGGFDVRTHRLCRRVLMFHRFSELGQDPCLVRSLDLLYEEDPTITTLRSVTQSGYIKTDGGYAKQTLPPLEFSYTQAAPDQTIHFLDRPSLENAPQGLADGSTRWVDLDGEGLAGLLTEQGGGWFYKRNGGGGVFGPLETIPLKPSWGLVGGIQLMDLANEGKKSLVDLSGPTPGFFSRCGEGEWGPFIPFPSVEKGAGSEGNRRFLDLNGDGIADVLITENDVLAWHPSLGKDGFGARQISVCGGDEEQGPKVLFSDAEESVYLADMSGDGLADIVRIRNGEICYWPNLGYGRFGSKVAMAGAPVFDAPEQFNQNRIRLADVDGSGPSDLIYLGRDDVRVWRNLAGNGWSSPRVLSLFPKVDRLVDVAVIDLLGDGTACLVWSSSQAGDADRPWRYLSLTGGVKPHLLSAIKNNRGAETRLRYAPSTKFYLQDARSGTPWITKLPFPVQVVERSETIDHITGNRFTTTFTYHHGYYDAAEQEFRGFGRVETTDTEEFASFQGAGLFPKGFNAGESVLHVPPVLTKTWYHTGAFLEGEKIAARCSAEYYAHDVHPQAAVGETSFPSLLATRERRDACRALKGSVLRREVYSLDGTDRAPHPYTVSQSSYEVRRVQPQADNLHGVFLVVTRETLEYYYERRPEDPRVHHQIALEVDLYGNTVKSVAIGYPRRVPLFPEQGAILATASEIRLVHRDQESGWYRLGLVVETKSFEVSLPLPPDGRFRPDPLRQLYGGLGESPFEEKVSPGNRRLVGCLRNIYLKNDLSGPLPSGQVESLALPYQTFEMAMTPGLLHQVYGDRVTNDMVEEGGFVFREGAWWSPSGTMSFAPEKFYVPVRFTTPFGNTSSVLYDDYSLLPLRVESSENPLFNNVVSAENDYRTLSPVRVKDANGNRTAVRSDALGLVVATALMGKEGAGEGDSLADPTTRVEYDLFAWMNRGRPTVARVFARETHGPGNLRWKETLEYSDGLGRLIQTKTRVRPGADAAPRWVGSGRTLFDNKGNAIKKYEPFFSLSMDFEDEAALVAAGVTPLLHYDPLGRLVRTDLPNGTFSKTEFEPWREVSWDPNDTVLESPWFAQRGSPDPASAPPSDPDALAAWQTAAHAGTPLVKHADGLGRAFLSVADAGPLGKMETRTVFDITNAPLAILDPLGRIAMEQTFDMKGQPLLQKGMDTGERRLLHSVGGNPLWSWDGMGRRSRTEYDDLRRPTFFFTAEPGGADVLRRATIYGERHPDAVSLNLRGKTFRLYDQAGESTSESFDFKGNPLASRRRMAKDYKNPLDWGVLAVSAHNPMGMSALADPFLESESFLNRTEYDAMNRPVKQITPDGSETLTSYDEGGHFLRTEAILAGRSTADAFIVDVRYDAKGRRTEVLYGNGVRTTYSYDPLTFRLTRLLSVRSGDILQDLNYVADPVGNVVAVRDDAQQTVFFQNAVVTPSQRYRFDPLYRLVHAEGREHRGQNASPQPDHDDFPRCAQPHPGDGRALRRYAEDYAYDAAGNILRMTHTADQGNWTRRYRYASDGNRLLATSRPGDPDGVFSDVYAHDAHGNMTALPHLPDIRWGDNDKMLRVSLGGGGTAFYVHDGGGERVRKVIETLKGILVERIKVGGVEIYRERNTEGVFRARNSLPVMDDQFRIAMVETLTLGDGSHDPLIRYQLGNHVGSAGLELDSSGALISYEEYHPYGSTSYQSGPNASEVNLKRYRYTGQERDDETGLYKNGARFYAPWLGRWTSADPAGLVDGPNLYRYSRDNPVTLADPGGMVPHDCLGGEGCGAGDDSSHQAILEEENRLQEQAAQEESLRVALAQQAEEERMFAQWAAEEDQIIIEGKVPIGRTLEETRRSARQYIVDHEYKGPGASNYVPPPPPDPRQKMYATAAADPIAAVFIGMALITEATLGEVFDFEINPERAAAGGAFTSALVNGVGAMNTPPPTAGRGPADPPPAKRAQVSTSSADRGTRYSLQDWGIRVTKNTENAYSFDSKTTGNVVETVLRRIEKMSQGAAIYVGTGGHGEKSGNSFVKDPALRDLRFYKADDATLKALKDLGIGRVLDLSDPKELKIFQEAEKMAKEPGQSHVYTLRAWCYSIRSFF